uniref:Uncharacterized protein n=1 Tax=Eutreptiella gymnastica TaxID=73025 RepID=A0A7S4CXS0_9EUGL
MRCTSARHERLNARGKAVVIHCAGGSELCSTNHTLHLTLNSALEGAFDLSIWPFSLHCNFWGASRMIMQSAFNVLVPLPTSFCPWPKWSPTPAGPGRQEPGIQSAFGVLNTR